MHRPTTNYPNTVNTTQDQSHEGGIFLETLHRLLDESEGTENNVISWSANGLSFQVHDIRRFEHYLMPVYFGKGSAYFSIDRHHEPLTTYGSFLRRLRHYDFHRGFVDGMLKMTCKHPLFVRGKMHLLKQITSNEVTPLFRRRDNNWPMPALSSDSHNTMISKEKSQRSEKAHRLRPCRTSISNIKKRTNNSFVRRINVSPHHLNDTRLSLKETLLRRKRPAYGSSERSEHSIFELLSNVPFPENSTCDNPDDLEPLSLSKSCDIDLTVGVDENASNPMRYENVLAPATSLSMTGDIEPLDPVCENNDGFLHGEIAEALARI